MYMESNSKKMSNHSAKRSSRSDAFCQKAVLKINFTKYHRRTPPMEFSF